MLKKLHVNKWGVKEQGAAVFILINLIVYFYNYKANMDKEQLISYFMYLPNRVIIVNKN